MANIALQGGKVVLKNGKASCTCCDPCASLPIVCAEGYSSFTWMANYDGLCYTTFPDLTVQQECMTHLTQTGDFWEWICPQAKYVIIISGFCLGNNGATNFYCKDDGIDSPVGTYSGLNYGGNEPEVPTLTITITEKIGESC